MLAEPQLPPRRVTAVAKLSVSLARGLLRSTRSSNGTHLGDTCHMKNHMQWIPDEEPRIYCKQT